MLFEIFNMIGPVASIRVCRDAVTRRSLGYAYVNFHSTADAERALDSLNYSTIKGRSCRIMWSQRDPSLRKSGSGNIFIKNLDQDIDNKALHDTFSAFGHILSCKVATDHEGKSKGYGFVHYETYEAADNAIKHVDGMLLNDKKVFVGHHIPRKERMSKLDQIKSCFTNVYVKNLESSVTEHDLKGEELFGKYGPITSVFVAMDHEGRSRGFAFINFEKHEDARIAVEELNEKEFRGKPLYVARAQKKSERQEELTKVYEQIKQERMNKYQGVNLYVKNLDDTVDDEQLKQEFSVYGSITSAKVMRDDKQHSRGFGFVCFNTAEEATKCVAEMNGKMVANKPIYVALAQRKDVRRSQLEAQRQQWRLQQQMQQGGMPQHMYGAPMFYPGNPVPPQAGPGQRGYGFPPQGMVNRPRYPNHPPQGNMPGQSFPGANGYAPNGPYGAMPPQMMAGGRNPRPRPQGQRPQGAPVQPAQTMPAGNDDLLSSSFVPVSLSFVAPAPAPEAAPKTSDIRSKLANADPQQQKMILGEQLYPLIEAQQPDLAAKITGMLLEMENAEIVNMLETPEELTKKVDEAVSVLEKHQSQQ
jgi:polyadenylate-binding protein